MLLTTKVDFFFLGGGITIGCKIQKIWYSCDKNAYKYLLNNQNKLACDQF